MARPVLRISFLCYVTLFLETFTLLYHSFMKEDAKRWDGHFMEIPFYIFDFFSHAGLVFLGEGCLMRMLCVCLYPILEA